MQQIVPLRSCLEIMSLLVNVACYLQKVAVKREAYAWLCVSGRQPKWYPTSAFVNDFQFDEKKHQHSIENKNNGTKTRTYFIL